LYPRRCSIVSCISVLAWVGVAAHAQEASGSVTISLIGTSQRDATQQDTTKLRDALRAAFLPARSPARNLSNGAIACIDSPNNTTIRIQDGTPACRSISQGGDRAKIYSAIVRFAKTGGALGFATEGELFPVGKPLILDVIGKGSPAASGKVNGQWAILLINREGTDFGALPSALMRTRSDGVIDIPILLLHEIGHVLYRSTGPNPSVDATSNAMALEYENAERHIRAYDSNERAKHNY
jgi:hypothetical protein